jgi:hypothetical protein
MQGRIQGVSGVAIPLPQMVVPPFTMQYYNVLYSLVCRCRIDLHSKEYGSITEQVVKPHSRQAVVKSEVLYFLSAYY